MRVVEIRPPFGLEAVHLVERADPPAPGPGQALVRIDAVSLNYRDLLVVRGTGGWRPPPGRIPASDGAGEVIAVGEGVSRFRPGDKVISTFAPNWIDGPLSPEKLAGTLGAAAADGVLADHVLFDAEALVAAPPSLSLIEAASLVCAGITAWQALSRADSLRPGRTVLVEGTGAVSLFALQLAAAAGATVIATSSSDDKLVQARALGAAQGVNYRTCPAWDEEVLRLTGGRGADHVVDIGGGSTLSRSIGAAAYEGVVSLVGLIGGPVAEIDVTQVFGKNLRLHGVETGSREMLEALCAFVEDKGLKPVIRRVFPLSEIGAAYAALAAGEQLGKIGIDLSMGRR